MCVVGSNDKSIWQKIDTKKKVPSYSWEDQRIHMEQILELVMKDSIYQVQELNQIYAKINEYGILKSLCITQHGWKRVPANQSQRKDEWLCLLQPASMKPIDNYLIGGIDFIDNLNLFLGTPYMVTWYSTLR